MKWHQYIRAGVRVACAGAMAAGLAGGASAEGGGAHAAWDYGTAHGPEHWADIDPSYASCRTGTRQSPIDIPEATATDDPVAFSFDYVPGPATVVNLGHTLQANVAPGNTLTFGGTQYELLQFHFHTPSENRIGGVQFPMEAHLVHRSAAGALAVVAVMIDAGAAGLIDGLPLPAHAGDQAATDTPLNPADLVPAESGFYAFDGSLTTPPCSEGVQWIVMRAPATADEATIARIAALLGPTNRPVNPLNGRTVLSGE